MPFMCQDVFLLRFTDNCSNSSIIFRISTESILQGCGMLVPIRRIHNMVAINLK